MADKYNLGNINSIIETELFSGIAGNVEGTNTGTITLNDKLSNYKFLVFDFKVKLVKLNNYYYISKIILSDQIVNLVNLKEPNTMIDFCWHFSNVYQNENDYFDIFNTSTLTSLDYRSNRSQCIRIVGIN